MYERQFYHKQDPVQVLSWIFQVLLQYTITITYYRVIWRIKSFDAELTDWNRLKGLEAYV